MHHDNYPHKFRDRHSWEERSEWNRKRDRENFSNQMDEDDRDQYRRRYRDDEEDDYRNSFETSEYNRRHTPRSHVSTNWTGRYEMEHDEDENDYQREGQGRTRYSSREDEKNDYRSRPRSRNNYNEYDWDEENDSFYGRGRNDSFPFEKKEKQWDDYGQMDEDDYHHLYNKNKPVGNSSMDTSHSAQRYSGRSGFYEDTQNQRGFRKPNDNYDERYHDESYERREPRSRREDSDRSDYVTHLRPTRRRRR